MGDGPITAKLESAQCGGYQRIPWYFAVAAPPDAGRISSLIRTGAWWLPACPADLHPALSPRILGGLSGGTPVMLAVKDNGKQRKEGGTSMFARTSTWSGSP